ncbi:MAG: hypothetical protein IJI53_06625 [Clostridia bacterium]|nr:hypothetical protein [Clostridia bacterium]MBR0407693.1 hypothetical protein [Clostridia bacterium]
MEIYWQGKDVTDFVQVRKCVVRDTCGGRCDSLELEFENAAGWYKWGPEEDDKIIVSQNGYDTGTMYLNTVLPEDGIYRILATALPCVARKKEYKSFIGKTIEEIMRACGMVTGMGFAVYGIDQKTVIPYIQQENESAAAFLCRLLMWEGAQLKCVNGKYVAIGISYAQDRAAHKTIEIDAKQPGMEYRRGGAKYKSVTVKTPYAKAKAEDSLVPSTHAQMVFDLPARNDIQAGRWARGLLMHHNRQDETLTIETDFDPGFSAMTRIDVTGSTDSTGAWLIEEAEHDLINKASRAKMYRCIQTIM